MGCFVLEKQEDCGQDAGVQKYSKLHIQYRMGGMCSDFCSLGMSFFDHVTAHDLMRENNKIMMTSLDFLNRDTR